MILHTRFSRSLIGHSRPLCYQILIPHWAPATLLVTEVTWSLDCSVFARRYWRNLFDLFSSPYLDVSVQVVSSLKVIQQLALLFWLRGNRETRLGFPIRTPSGQSFVAANRRLSWLCTSFIGDKKQGIHCLRYLTRDPTHHIQSRI